MIGIVEVDGKRIGQQEGKTIMMKIEDTADNIRGMARDSTTRRFGLRVVICNPGDSENGTPSLARPWLDMALLDAYLTQRKQAERPALYPVQFLVADE